MSTPSVPDPADFLFRKAAEDARALIPFKEKRLAELRAEIELVQNQLLRLQRMASLEDDDFLLPTAPRLMKLSDLARFGADEQRPGPQVRDMIFVALMKHHERGALKVGEISEAIKNYNGKEFADSTLYGHLGKMKNENLLTNENNRWGLTSDGVKHALGLDLV